MLLNPAIFIQVSVSAACTLLLIIAAGFTVNLIRSWDIQSGSERQLKLERHTYLISTIVSFAFIFSAAGFIYFIQTCESISPQFVGAMCATGVLNANPYGWPVLMLKIFIFFGSITWVLFNSLDNQGYDYPLIKIKYGLLICLLPLFVFETTHLYLFFSNLDPDLIVSCCGSMFSVSAQGVAAHVSAVEPETAFKLLTGSGLAALLSLPLALKYKTGVYVFALLVIIAFITALVCLVSLIGPYIYEHPNHHCPLCMLKSGYHFSGFFLYLPLFSGTAAALAAAAFRPCSRFKSIKTIVPKRINTLIYFSSGMMILFYGLIVFYILDSNLTLGFYQ